MSTPEHLQNPVDGFVDRYYNQLIQQGQEQAALSPAVCLTGPGNGTVLWYDGETLSGYKITTHSSEREFPQMIREKTRIGFTEDMQREGLWVLRKVTGSPDRYGNVTYETDRSSLTYAHYDVRNSQWHVTRLRGGATPEGRDLEHWAEGWQPATTTLTDPEKEAIARIAQDSDLILDAAASFADRHEDYSKFERTLKDRASGSPAETLHLDLLLAPWNYRFYGCRLDTTLRNLSNLGPALYRALTGKPQSDSTDLMSTLSLAAKAKPVTDPTQPLDIREGTIYPPFEQITSKWQPEAVSRRRAQGVLSRIRGWLKELHAVV